MTNEKDRTPREVVEGILSKVKMRPSMLGATIDYGELIDLFEKALIEAEGRGYREAMNFVCSDMDTPLIQMFPAGGFGDTR